MLKPSLCPECDETCQSYQDRLATLSTLTKAIEEGSTQAVKHLSYLKETGKVIEVDEETGQPIKRKTTLKPSLCLGCDETCDNYQAILAALPSLTKAAEEGSPRAAAEISYLKQIGKVIEVDEETGQPIRTQSKTIPEILSEIETMLFALGYIRARR